MSLSEFEVTKNEEEAKEATKFNQINKSKNNIFAKDKTTIFDDAKIKDELNSARKLFKENNWPTIDVTRKSVEETAASVIKIFEIKNKKNA